MKESTISMGVVPAAIVDEAWQEVGANLDRFCLTAGLAALVTMMDGRDAAELCDPRYGRAVGREGVSLGQDQGEGRLQRRQGRD